METCIPWIHHTSQQVDLAFNLFFMVYFFIRVSVVICIIVSSLKYITTKKQQYISTVIKLAFTCYDRLNYISLLQNYISLIKTSNVMVVFGGIREGCWDTWGMLGYMGDAG